MGIDWKNVLSRAGWTFLEAFLVAMPATITTETFAGAAWKSVLLSAACAGISAVKTLIVDMIQQYKTGWIPPEDDE